MQCRLTAGGSVGVVLGEGIQQACHIIGARSKHRHVCCAPLQGLSWWPAGKQWEQSGTWERHPKVLSHCWCKVQAQALCGSEARQLKISRRRHIIQSRTVCMHAGKLSCKAEAQIRPYHQERCFCTTMPWVPVSISWHKRVYFSLASVALLFLPTQRAEENPFHLCMTIPVLLLT
eukprot:scaffold21374_cov17-Tisochrysis_lutea.AAC.1